MGKPNANMFASTRASRGETQAAKAAQDAKDRTVDVTTPPQQAYTNKNSNINQSQLDQASAHAAQTQQQAIANSSQDLQLGVRSEFGQDGPEEYFETYINQLKIGNVNIFINQRNDNYFLLGSCSGAGILGSTKYGSVTTGSTRIQESQCIQDFAENFTTTTYKDAGSTTASGWGTGSLVFTTGGSQAVVANWKSGSYSLTQFDRIYVGITYRQYGGSSTLFEASFNGGSNYTTISPFSETVGSPVGSDFRLRITDQQGSLILTRIDIITKGESFT